MEKNNFKVLILVPAYNSNKYINRLLTEIRNTSDLPILIIDDGSDIPIIYSNKFFDTIIIRHENNMGKGIALMTGIKWANKKKYSHVITIDSDLQHSPEYIKQFISIDHNSDIVIGYREFSNNMPYHRRLSNYITSKLLSIRTGIEVKDSQSGYRRYKIDPILNHKYIEKGFQFESEILIKLLINGASINYIRISTIYNDQHSSINNISDTLKFIKLYFRSIMWRTIV